MSEWKVSRTVIGGEPIFQVYRKIDESKTDHSGNREYYDKCFDSKPEAAAAADRLNQEG